MAEERAQVNGIELAYERLGDPSGQPLLLVMGLSMQMIHWDDALCGMLIDRGFHLVRFDNRDVGHSTQIDAPVPDVRRALVGGKINAPYLLSDMAADAVGLLDHLGIESAHVVGASMGGMIAQTMAIEHPERVSSLTSIMSTTGDRRVGRPKLRVLRVLLKRAPAEKEAFVEYFVRMFRLIGSPGFPYDADRIREEAAATFERGYHPAGSGRQLAAIMASGDRTEKLRGLRVPTTVIHGRNDPLVPFKGGRATAAAIPGANFLAIPGMGHNLPESAWPQVVDAIAETASRAAPAGVA